MCVSDCSDKDLVRDLEPEIVFDIVPVAVILLVPVRERVNVSD